MMSDRRSAVRNVPRVLLPTPRCTIMTTSTIMVAGWPARSEHQLHPARERAWPQDTA